MEQLVLLENLLFRVLSLALLTQVLLKTGPREMRTECEKESSDESQSRKGYSNFSLYSKSNSQSIVYPHP